MRRTGPAGLVVAVLALASACGGGGGEVDLSAGDPVAGQTAFGTHCVACHGPEGEGSSSGPPLVGPEARDITDQQVVDAVRDGVATDQWAGSPMPALPAVSGEDLADIVAHLRLLRGDPEGVPAPQSESPSSP